VGKEVPKGTVKIAHRHFDDIIYGYDEMLYLGLNHAFYLKGKVALVCGAS